MTSLDAAYYADRAVQHTAEIIENVRLARETYRVRFHAPELARSIVPGQFLMLRLAGVNDPLIGRPLALYDTVVSASGDPTAVDVVYLVKGKLTSLLWQMRPGQQLDVWGLSAMGSALHKPEAQARGPFDRRATPPTNDALFPPSTSSWSPAESARRRSSPSLKKPWAARSTAIHRAMCRGPCT